MPIIIAPSDIDTKCEEPVCWFEHSNVQSVTHSAVVRADKALGPSLLTSRYRAGRSNMHRPTMAG